jgi:Ankyrin repeats (many copies)
VNDEVDDLYRRASAQDSSRPSESVRRAVLDHAARLTAQRLSETSPVKIDFTRPAANQAWRRPAIFGTLAAAALAGLMVAPQLLTPRGPDTPVAPPVVASRDPSAAAPPAPELAQSEDKLQDRMSKRQSAPPPEEAKNNLEPRAGARQSASRAESARSRANEQSADQAQGTDNVQSSPGSQDAVTAQNPASANGAAKSEVRRLQGVTGGISAFSTAARLADPAVALRRAAEIGDLTALQVLIDKQSEIDARDSSGRTALMMAALRGQSQAVDVLLAHGADPNAADARGITPLQAAIAGDQPAIAAALRRAGAR